MNNTKQKSVIAFEEATVGWGFEYNGYFADDGRWVYLDHTTGVYYGMFLLGWEKSYHIGYKDGYEEGNTNQCTCG